jgi:exopolysaccharide biosynthesis predicted pyruvyltransferase EpsI
MKKKSILYSTTRMTNIGDEVIYWGVRSLIDEVMGDHTPILYNRHLSIRPNNRNFDNSIAETRHKSSWLDYAVVAGSPDWYGVRSNEFYRTVKRNKLRFSAIGIGSAETHPSIPKWIQEVYQNQCDMVVTRDQITHDYFKRFFPEVQVRNCPGIFHKMGTKRNLSGKVKNVCINYQAGARKITEATGGMKNLQIDAFNELKNDFNVSILCNFIDDVDEAQRIFPDANIHYSADAHEYFDLFELFDIVIGPRVHGCLGGLACGIPAVILDDGTNVRRTGVVGQIPILGKSYEIDDLKAYVSAIELTEESEKIHEWVDSKRAGYLAQVIEKITPETAVARTDVDYTLTNPWYDYLMEVAVKLPEGIKQKFCK